MGLSDVVKNSLSPFSASAIKYKKEDQSIAGSLNKNQSKTLQKDILIYSNPFVKD